MRKAVLLLSSLLLAAPVLAQISVGMLPLNLSSNAAGTATPQTYVSLENPATGSGAISSVSFNWSANCGAAVKIKFFRRSGNTLTLVDERGPFDTVSGIRGTTVSLAPAVNVQAGDLIAIVRVQNCGSPLVEPGTGTQG